MVNQARLYRYGGMAIVSVSLWLSGCIADRNKPKIADQVAEAPSTIYPKGTVGGDANDYTLELPGVRNMVYCNARNRTASEYGIVTAHSHQLSVRQSNRITRHYHREKSGLCGGAPILSTYTPRIRHTHGTRRDDPSRLGSTQCGEWSNATEARYGLGKFREGESYRA